MASGEKVLVVDDEPLVLDTLCEMLSVEGYEVEGVSSAAAALKLAADKHFDVLLADLAMPVKDGLELVREFRAHSPDTAALIITGYGSALTWMQDEIHDLIRKPIGRADLASRVAKVLKRRQDKTIQTSVYV